MIGAVIGLTLLGRRRQNADRRILILSVNLIAGLAVLGYVVAQLATFGPTTESTAQPDWAFLLLGLVSGLSSLALARSGVRALRAAVGVDDQAFKVIYDAQLVRVVLFQGIGTAAAVVAILLIVLS